MPTTEIAKLNSSALTCFNTRNISKACGLDVDVYYPDCMKYEEGGFQAHTVGKASYEWHDFEVFVQISAAVHDCGKGKVKLLKRAVPEMNRNDFKDLAEAEGGRFLDGGVVNIRDVKVIWLDVISEVRRMGETSMVVMRQYIIPADLGRLFYLRISVGSLNGECPMNDFKALSPMIRRCAVALTLKEYSQFHKPEPRWKFW